MIKLSHENQERKQVEINLELLADFELMKLYPNWDRQAHNFWEELAQQYRVIQ